MLLSFSNGNHDGHAREGRWQCEQRVRRGQWGQRGPRGQGGDQRSCGLWR